MEEIQNSYFVIKRSMGHLGIFANFLLRSFDNSVWQRFSSPKKESQELNLRILYAKYTPL